MDLRQTIGDRPILNLVGEKVALGPFRRELLSQQHRWRNDFEARRTIAVAGDLVPKTWDDTVVRYESAGGDSSNVAFAIYELGDPPRYIGNAGLWQIDHRSRSAEFWILIGEKDCWGKGYGTETTRLVLDYGFNTLGLHCVHLRVYSFNERAIRAYTRAGFTSVGRWREAHRLGGRAYDIILMDCLASEFAGSTPGEPLPATASITRDDSDNGVVGGEHVEATGG
jgi:RimJ/RimL family protein N-acetyltransferase